MKKCSLCLKTKPSNAFFKKVSHNHNGIPGNTWRGLNSRCKQCMHTLKVRYREKKRFLYREMDMRARARKLKRLPPWSQREAILEFYKHCPVGHEVDHFFPLLGKMVSGLHVLENLQYLTVHENRVKAAKFPSRE